MYTQNAICREGSCTNPIFPGLNDLSRLELLTWQCPATDRSSYSQYMSFCGDAVVYEPALPSPNTTATALNLLVKAQDDAASTMFFFHLNGLGYDAWEHQKPWKSQDECVKSTWRMVCYTYFPKAEAGCQKGQATQYLRPCKDCCENYLNKCKVECCDESPKCVFSHTLDVGAGKALVQTGYVDAAAPSASCTGLLSSGARRTITAPLALIIGLFGIHLVAASDDEASTRARRTSASTVGLGRNSVLFVFALVAISTTLTGCDLTIPQHKLGNWRSKDDYLVSYEFIPPGQTVAEATLNSCSTEVATTVQCSGRGYCRSWDTEKSSSVAFCSCDRDFTDPECRTRRKSQTKAFFTALFGGIVGLDYFYLGLPLWGLTKLTTMFFIFGCAALAGSWQSGLPYAMVWWLIDVVRSGAGPVYANDFRVSADLPHWVFVIFITFFALVMGFVWAMTSYLRFRAQKRSDVLKMQEQEESRKINSREELAALGPQYYAVNNSTSFASPRAGFSGYGSTLPLPNAGAGYAPQASFTAPYGLPMSFPAGYGIRL